MRPSLLAAIGILAFTGSAALAAPADFNGRALIALSDGAMLASGYIDGRLGPRRPDLLSVIPLDPPSERQDIAVSNSVATWPNVMAVTADGRFAIVTEPFGQPSDDATEFSAIPRGNRITVVDLSEPHVPRITQQIEAPGPTAAVDIHPGGSLVAVTLPFDGQIALYPLEEGTLGQPVIQDLGVADLPNRFVPEFKWHPSGEAAAVTLGGADRVIFYRFDDNRLMPWGEPLRTAPLPGKGEWTSDGRHFIVTTITATGDMAQIGYGQNASLFAVFAFDADDETNSPPRRSNDRSTSYESGPVQHARLGHVPAGMGYVENFALSPDGRWLVGLNMAASWLPQDHPGRTDFSELTLFGFDATTGRLTPHGITRLDGVVLPQGIVFDTDGSHVAVTSFQHDDREGGSLSFWRLQTQGQPRLEKDGEPLALPRGAHLLHLIE